MVGGLIALCATASAGPARAQGPDYHSGERYIMAVAANIVVTTGLVAGKVVLFGERDAVLRSAANAAAGTLLNVAGKALVGEGSATSSWTGRLVGAVGASVVQNALFEDPAFECIRLPAGPLWLNLRRCPEPLLTVDGVSVVGVVIGVQTGAFDPGRSARVGAVVFRLDPDAPHALAGRAVGGTLVYAGTGGGQAEQGRVAHEMVHVLQHDFGAILISKTVARAAAASVEPPLLRRALRAADWGFHVPLALGLSMTPFDIMPLLEAEARVWARGGG